MASTIQQCIASFVSPRSTIALTSTCNLMQNFVWKFPCPGDIVVIISVYYTQSMHVTVTVQAYNTNRLASKLLFDSLSDSHSPFVKFCWLVVLRFLSYRAQLQTTNHFQAQWRGCHTGPLTGGPTTSILFYHYCCLHTLCVSLAGSDFHAKQWVC